MFDNTDNVTRAEARDALDSADKMESAGWRRGVPERWFGAIISALIGSLFAAVLLVVFFGSIVIRRTYDIAWVPLVAGLLVALFVFLASERERRAYLAKGARGEPK